LTSAASGLIVAGGVVGRGDGLVCGGLVDLHGIAVELWLGEEVRGAAEVHDREIELLLVGVNASAAADDLLELGHRADGAVEHDQPTGLGVHARGEQPGRRGDDGVIRFRIDEIADLGLAFGVAAGDPHHVAVVLGVEVGVLVDERLPHPGGVFFVDTEHDRLLHPVAGGLQKLRHLAGHELRAVVEHERAVEILLVVDPVFDLVAVAVGLSLLGPVALDVHVHVDLHDLVGGEEAVVDALLERVGIDGFAEVFDVRVDGAGLVGAGRAVAAVFEIVLKDDLFRRGGKPAPGPGACRAGPGL
jgi:hypothetical protein